MSGCGTPLRRDRDELEDYLRLGPGRKQIAGRLGMKNCAGLGGGRWSWTLTFAKSEASQSRRRPRIGPAIASTLKTLLRHYDKRV